MKHLRALIVFLLVSLPAAAQFTTVTATVVDPNGIPYSNGTVAAILVNTSGTSVTLNGFSYNPPTQPAGLDSSGKFTINLAANASLSPAGTKWNFWVCSALGTVNPSVGTGSQCFTLASPITIAGASQDISANLNAAAIALTRPSNAAGTVTVSGNPTNGNCIKFTGATVIADAGAPCVAPSAVPTQVVQNGLIAEYRLTEGSGTTITDFSGNGNTGTFPGGANNPTWISPSGLSFAGNQFVSLPAALNSAVTVQFVLGFQYAAAGNNYTAPIAGGPSTPANCSRLLLDNQHGSGAISGLRYFQFESWNNTFRAQWRYTITGNAFVSWTVGTGGPNDQLSINGSTLVDGGSATGLLSAGNYQLGGSAGGLGGGCPAATMFYTGQIFYVVIYNRALTQAEISLNNQFLQQVMLARGQPIKYNNTAVTDQILYDGDSEFSASLVFVPVLPATINQYQVDTSGFTAEQNLSDFPLLTAALNPPSGASRNAVAIWTGINDIADATSGINTSNVVGQYCRQARVLGFRCIVMDVMDRGSHSALKNGIDGNERLYWQNYADGFIDIGADPNMGCDGCNASTTFFSGNLHPTTASANNIVMQYIQRGVNRVFGNNDWTSATTYASGAPAATAITAASEVGNTVTITSTLNPPVGSCVVISGVTPAGYNNVSGECYTALTTSAGSFTYFNFNTGLGAGTVFGTASVPLQKDVDTYTILGGAGAGNNFTLEPCGGYTGQKLYLKNTNTNSWTVTAFGNDLIDGAATATVATNAVLVLQAKVVTPATPVCSWVKVQNN